MRQVRIHAVLLVLIALASINTTCPFNDNLISTTGVSGLNTADEIVQYQPLRNVIIQLDNAGVPAGILLDDSFQSPPIIEGRYRLSGERIIPSRQSLAAGAFRWSNQSSNNHISTDYTQFFGAGLDQSGVSRVGEIIRGTGDGFTVYSIIDVEQAGCEARSLLVINAERTPSGFIRGVYCAVVLEGTPGCGFFNTAGTMDFTPR